MDKPNFSSSLPPLPPSKSPSQHYIYTDNQCSISQCNDSDNTKSVDLPIQNNENFSNSTCINQNTNHNNLPNIIPINILTKSNNNFNHQSNSANNNHNEITNDNEINSSIHCNIPNNNHIIANTPNKTSAKRSLMHPSDSRCKPKYNVSFSEKPVFYEHEGFNDGDEEEEEEDEERRGFNSSSLTDCDYDNMFDDDDDDDETCDLQNPFNNIRINNNNNNNRNNGTITLGGLLERKRAGDDGVKPLPFADNIHADLESVLKELDIMTSSGSYGNSDASNLNDESSDLLGEQASSICNRDDTNSDDLDGGVDAHNNAEKASIGVASCFTDAKGNDDAFKKVGSGALNGASNGNLMEKSVSNNRNYNDIAKNDSIDGSSINVGMSGLRASSKNYIDNEDDFKRSSNDKLAINAANKIDNNKNNSNYNNNNNKFDYNHYDDYINGLNYDNYNDRNDISSYLDSYNNASSHNHNKPAPDYNGFGSSSPSMPNLHTANFACNKINESNAMLNNNTNNNNNNKNQHSLTELKLDNNNCNSSINPEARSPDVTVDTNITNHIPLSSHPNDNFLINNNNNNNDNKNHNNFNDNMNFIDNILDGQSKESNVIRSIDNYINYNNNLNHVDKNDRFLENNGSRDNIINMNYNNKNNNNLNTINKDSTNNINKFNNTAWMPCDMQSFYNQSDFTASTTNNNKKQNMNFQSINNVGTNNYNHHQHLPLPPLPPHLSHNQHSSPPNTGGQTLFSELPSSSSSSCNEPHFECNTDDNSSCLSDKKKDDQVLMKVYSEDESSKTVTIDSGTTVRDLCDMLIKKYRHPPSKAWSLVEHWSDLQMERLLEEHLLVLEELAKWCQCPKQSKSSKNHKSSNNTNNNSSNNSKRYSNGSNSSSTNTYSNIIENSNNTLWFVELPRKYGLLQSKQVIPSLSSGSYVPECEGPLFLKGEGKKTWKRFHFVLRASGLYYIPKGKTNKPSELERLVCLADADILTGRENWNKAVKAPTIFGIVIKSISRGASDTLHMKYLCADDARNMYRWFDCLRLVKHGKQLCDNFNRPIKLPHTPPSFRPPPPTSWSTLIDCELERVASIHKQHVSLRDCSFNGNSSSRTDSVYSDEIPSHFKSNSQFFQTKGFNNDRALNCSSSFLIDPNSQDLLRHLSSLPGFTDGKTFSGNLSQLVSRDKSFLSRGSEGMMDGHSGNNLSCVGKSTSTNRISHSNIQQPSLNDPWTSQQTDFSNKHSSTPGKLSHSESLNRNCHPLQLCPEPIYESIPDHQHLQANPQPDVLGNLSKSKSQENFMEKYSNAVLIEDSNSFRRKSSLGSSADHLNSNRQDYSADKPDVSMHHLNTRGDCYPSWNNTLRVDGRIGNHDFPRPRTPEILNFLAQSKKNLTSPSMLHHASSICTQQPPRMYSRNHPLSRSFNAGMKSFGFDKSSDTNPARNERLPDLPQLESPAYDNPHFCLMQRDIQQNYPAPSENWSHPVNLSKNFSNNRNSNNSYYSNSSNSSGFHSNNTNNNNFCTHLGTSSPPCSSFNKLSTNFRSPSVCYSSNQPSHLPQHPFHPLNQQKISRVDTSFQDTSHIRPFTQSFSQAQHSSNAPSSELIEYYEGNKTHPYLTCNT